ncbi:hypothetical protein [Streptomyces hoynatensis]|uniref:hypothetical protein n=1 Tax=Streptomyces hoynatensis TaxID=1141874 RepID=UPI0011C3F4FE|nr:hypothetical protein [Streptomyces hoynatensis]
MARGRHRNAALHRVLIPAALGGSALLCAAGAWLVGGEPGDRDALVPRVLVAVAAFAAVAGAALLRRWDLEAGRQVARERAAKAGMSWQVEERQAELEEAQELVAALEEKIRGKRADLGRLRSEHADLLRRYATAESERAKALEGRRRLAIEAAEPAKALPARATDHRAANGAPTPLTYLQAYEALNRLSRNAARQREAEAASAYRESEPYVRPRPEALPEGQRPRGLPAAPQRTGGFDFFGTGKVAGQRRAREETSERG